MKINDTLIIFLFFVFVNSFTNPCIAQDAIDITPKNYKTFGIKEGFEVNKVHSMEFDNEGWLWISGTTVNNINKIAPIIQRYNGTNFYKLSLPNFETEKEVKVELEKRTDGQLYANFNFDNSSKLFRINPKTLVFKEIALPISGKDRDIKLFAYKDYFLTFISDRKSTKLYKLNNALKFSLLTTDVVDEKSSKSFSNFIGFDDHFILNEFRTGVHIYQENGTLLKDVSLKDLGLNEIKMDYALNISTWFKNDGNVYVQFLEIPDYYQYHPKDKSWSKTALFKNNIAENHKLSLEEKITTDTRGNILRKELYENGVKLSLYKKGFMEDQSFFIKLNALNQFVSRDLSKELFVENSGKFFHFNFKKQKVLTFLTDNSIRSMLQLSKEEFLVGTDFAGWYTINVKTNETKSFELTLNNQIYLPTENRGIISDSLGYWSNNDKGIIYVDKQTHKITTYVNFPVSAMVNDTNSIYYGTYKYNLMRFDKKNKKNIVLAPTPQYDIQGIVKINNTIYMACAEGMLIFENGKTTLHKPTNDLNDNFLRSVVYDKNQGILAGSQSGKLFRFHPKTSTFSLLYKDYLNASIATILFDDKDLIWLSTFKGIVAFNPKTKAATRYSMNDGLSFYEGNRYSALKTEDGHFLVGTLNGLNYFHPDDLVKKITEADLRLTLVNFYDKKDKRQVIEMAPFTLNNLKTITLPPENKSIYLQFSLVGIYDGDNINYRYRVNNEPWIHLANKNEIRLVNLAAGNYQLQIEALDLSEISIGKPIMLNIIAAEFFYKTFWFYAFIILLGLGIAFWYFREKRKKYRLKELFSTQIINSQEIERSRIAKELHDSIGQSLLVLKNTFLLKSENNKDEVRMIEDTIKEVRDLSHNLHPFQFEKLGLKVSLENLINKFQKSSHVFYSCNIDDISNIVPKEKKLFVFRMIQECISNVEKHSEATACNLSVIDTKTHLVFQLKDNGKGFIVENKMDDEASLGLKTLKERSQYINAYFNIKSELNIGTVITIKISKI